jgi:ABC-type glycerol-3-phosphate transport system permease component
MGSRQTIAPYAVAVLMAILFLAPLIVAAMTSIKAPSELSRVLALPEGFYLENYVRAFELMGRPFLNSLLITGPAVFFSVAVGTMAAYPLSHMSGASGRFVYFFLLTGMLVPFQIVQIPLFIIIRYIGLYDTIPGMWLVHTAYSVPFCTFFMRNFFATVPRSIYEAGLIDGCTKFDYFWRLLLPASVSGMAALAIIQSRYIWNDLLFAITLTLSDRARPVTVVISGFVGGLQVEYGPLMAATAVSVLPVMLTYLLFQRAFIRGLLGGTGK